MTEAEKNVRRVMLERSKAVETDLLHSLAQFGAIAPEPCLEPRWKSIARTHFEEGFMALNRAISGGGRI